MPWSNRTRTIKPKYQNNKISKKNLKQKIKENLTKMAFNKLGLIQELNENLDQEALSIEREKKLVEAIIKEVIIYFYYFR